MRNTEAEIQLINNRTKSNSKLIYATIGRDSIEVCWQTHLKSNFSPVERIMNSLPADRNYKFELL